MFGPTTKLFGHAVAGGFGALAVLFALVVWRLAAGPVSLAFLEPYVEEALSTEATGLTVSFDDLVLGWAGWDRTLDIRAVGVRARSAESGALAGVPEMSIELSIPALSRGLIAPTRLELFGPGVRLVRDETGSIDLGFGDSPTIEDAEAAQTNDLAAELLRDLLLPPDPNRAMGYLREVNVFEARLMLKDEQLGIEWIAPSAFVSLERHRDGIRMNADLSLDLPGEPLNLSAAATYDVNSRLAKMALDFVDVDPARIANTVPGLEDLADLDVPVSGTVDLVVAAEGHVIDVGFDVSTGPGRILAPTPFEPGTRFDVALVQASGRIVEGFSALALDELFVDFGGPTLRMTGRFAGDPDAPDTNAELVIKRVPADQVARYWPGEVSPEARGWLVEHMTAGRLDEVVLRLALEAEDWPKSNLEPGKVSGTFAVSDASIWYHTVLPPVDNVSATGWFDTTQLHAVTTGGVSGPLALSGGAVDLSDIDTAEGVADIAVTFAGPASETLTVLDLPPFEYASALGLDPAAVSGSVAGDLAVAVPLLEDLELTDIDIGVAADLHEFAVARGGMNDLIGERALDAGEASIVLDTDGFDLAGEARIEGVLVDVHWRENFTLPVGEQQRRRVALSGRLDDDHRAAFGLDRPWINGPVDVTVEIEDSDAGATLADVDIQADAATIELDALGWAKDAGAPAEARLALEIADREIQKISSFGMRADGLSTAGSASRDDNGLWTINFDRVDSALNDVSGQVRMRGDGGLAIALEGDRLDLRPYFGGSDQSDAETESEATSQPFDLSARVAVVLLDEDMTLHGVQAQVSYDGEMVRNAIVAGDLDGRYEMVLRMEDGIAANSRAITLASNDAGGVFKTLGVTEKMTGGVLRVDAVVDDTQDDHPVTGTMTVEDFYIVDAPVVAKILNVMTLTGALEMLQGDGMPFDQLIAPFVYRGDVLTFDDARANGLSIGLTLEGDIDIGGDKVDVSGTIVPAYMLNSALGNIPLLGDLFTGGEGKGIFAATYAVEGPRDNPAVSVNPLAALAPGILRELFSSFEPSETSIRSEAPGSRTQ